MALLPIMAFDVPDKRRPFDPNKQVKSASIDIRLDGVFWVPRRRRWRRSIDLRQKLSDRDMQRVFERRVCRAGEGITLQPGQVLHGRTYEQFAIPSTHAGKIEGRSTFARLGLSVHCTGDFINPGWRGHMPLQLVNHGRLPLVLTPYIDVCQLVLVKLGEECSRPYGSANLNSKYQNDEGGPSKFADDERLSKLQAACGGANLPAAFRDEFERVLKSADGDTIERFQAYLSSRKLGDLTTARDIIEQFARRDELAGRWVALAHALAKWGATGLIASSLALLAGVGIVGGKVSVWHVTFWATAAAISFAGMYYGFFAQPPLPRLKVKDVEAAYDSMTK